MTHKDKIRRDYRIFMNYYKTHTKAMNALLQKYELDKITIQRILDE